jgi:hypothetical protein
VEGGLLRRPCSKIRVHGLETMSNDARQRRLLSYRSLLSEEEEQEE